MNGRMRRTLASRSGSNPSSAYLFSSAFSVAWALDEYFAQYPVASDVVRSLPAGQGRLVERHVADEVEGAVVAADLLSEGLEEHALLLQLGDDGLLAVAPLPPGEEGV